LGAPLFGDSGRPLGVRKIRRPQRRKLHKPKRAPSAHPQIHARPHRTQTVNDAVIIAALPPFTQNLLAHQCGVIGLWQMDLPTRRQIQRLLPKGQAKQITWSTYLLACGAPTREQLLWAAYLHCGPEAAMAGRTALALAGWDDKARRSVHVIVARTRRPQGIPDWLRVHQSQNFPTSRFGTLPRVEHHLAAVQAARWANSDSEVLYVLTSAMQQRIITAPRLQTTALAHPNARRRQLVLQIAGEFAAGMQSMNERRFSNLCRRFGLPPPARQTRRIDVGGVWRYTDAEFTRRDGRTLIVEIDGLHHLEPTNWLNDIDRQNDLVLSVDGLVLRVATWTLNRQPAPFMAKIAALL